MRRWIRRISITLVTLLLLGVVGVQIVLSTDVPRRLVLEEVQRSLELGIGVDAVETGWWGETTLKNVTLSLPLAGESFLKVKSLKVTHTNLIPMLLGRPLTLTALEFESPELIVRQDASGRWNVQDVMDLLGRAGGGKQAAQGASPQKAARAELPGIIVRDGAVRITDRSGRTASIEPVNVRGQPDGELVWKYDAAAGPPDQPRLHLVGKLAPSDTWKHEVSIALSDPGPWIDPWLGGGWPGVKAFVDGVTLQGDWRGEMAGGGISGRLLVNDAHSGKTRARGAMRIDITGGVLRARPENMSVADVAGVPSDILLKSGEVTLEGAAIHSDNLMATAGGGDVRLGGRYDWADGSADVDAQWVNIAIPAHLTQSGSLRATMRSHWPDSRTVEGTLASHGGSPEWNWDTVVEVKGSGRALAGIPWSVTAQRLRIGHYDLTANLDGLSAKLAEERLADGSRLIRLTEVNEPAGELSAGRPRGSLDGEGYYRFPKPDGSGGDWWLYVAGSDWRLSESATVRSRFGLDVSGDRNWARVAEFYSAADNGIQIWAQGAISRGEGYPADLSVYSWYPPFTLDAYDAGAALETGAFRSELHVSGGTWPLRLDVNGQLAGKSVAIGHHTVGDLSMSTSGRINAVNRGYEVKLHTDHLRLFEGSWNLNVHYTSADKLGRFGVELEGLPLKSIDDFMNPPPRLGGTLVGKWYMTAPNLQFSKAEVDGSWEVKDFTAPHFSADQVKGELRVRAGDVTVGKIRALRNKGGQIDGSARFRLKDPSRLGLTAIVAAWPVPIGDLSILAYAQTDGPVAIDLRSMSGNGAFKLDLYPAYRHVDTGALKIEGNVNHRTIAVTKLEGDVLGGHAIGSGSYDFDDLLKSRAMLEWQGLDTRRLAKLFPQTGDLTGTYSGSIALGPPTVPRPLGPLQLDLKFSPVDGAWRLIPLSGGEINAFYDPGRDAHEHRLIVDQSRLGLAGGDVHVFARATRHPLNPPGANPAEWSFNAQLDARNLDLNPLVRAGDPAAHDMPGRLSGKVLLIGDPKDQRRLFGEGNLRLTDSDLAESTVISALYSLLSIKIGPKTPIGKGAATFRLEGDRLDITGARYFNRGVEARGSGAIRDIWNGSAATIEGYVIGSARPLKDLKVPFAADLDKILAVVQQGVTTIKVGGTLHQPQVGLAPFGDISVGLRSLILGDVEAETRGSAGP